ncbi:hypothetical protein GCM10007116_17660 [Sulfodiicoccus acidiphilus]|uniref:Uncharacterized protein n=1 Tax=Sulfodiicoccus acidiphilus TaxID=1670455 RepID=A0A830H0R9_9CREN|nr:hypothetical protein GCM10007116_17660 [Sulfodiicoccus acidiphilus]
MIYLAYKYSRRGDKEDMCNEMARKRFVVMTKKKTTDLILYLISRNVGLNPTMYDVDSTIHLAFSSADELNKLAAEIPITFFDHDNKTFLRELEDDGSFFFIKEEGAVLIVKRLESYEFVRACMEDSESE